MDDHGERQQFVGLAKGQQPADFEESISNAEKGST
jgi:hypothetical protein